MCPIILQYCVVYPGLHLFNSLNEHDCNPDKGAYIARSKMDMGPRQNTTATKRRNLHLLRSTFIQLHKQRYTLELGKVEIEEFLNYSDGMATAEVSGMVWSRSISVVRIVTEIRRVPAPNQPLGEGTHPVSSGSIPAVHDSTLDRSDRGMSAVISSSSPAFSIFETEARHLVVHNVVST